MPFFVAHLGVEFANSPAGWIVAPDMSGQQTKKTPSKGNKGEIRVSSLDARSMSQKHRINLWTGMLPDLNHQIIYWMYWQTAGTKALSICSYILFTFHTSTAEWQNMFVQSAGITYSVTFAGFEFERWDPGHILRWNLMHNLRSLWCHRKGTVKLLGETVAIKSVNQQQATSQYLQFFWAILRSQGFALFCFLLF